MIIIEQEHREKYCSSCTPYRKPNADSLSFYTVKLLTSKDSNALVIRFCSDCVKELKEKLP